MTTTHTPTPYRVHPTNKNAIQDFDGRFIAYAESGGSISKIYIDQPTREANAAFLVHAANHHDRLTGALAVAVTLLEREAKNARGEDAPWWMDEPERGGVDVESITAFLERAHRLLSESATQ